MRSKGCEPVMVKVRDIMNTQKNISCDISKKVVTQTLDVTNKNTIDFKINGNAEAAQTMITGIYTSVQLIEAGEQEVRKTLDQTIKDLGMAGAYTDNVKASIDALIQASNKVSEAALAPNYGYPRIIISNFNARNDSATLIQQTSRVDIDNDVDLRNSMIAGSQLSAQTEIMEKLGLDALPQGIKTISDEKVNNYYETNQSTINDQANTTNISVGSGDVITVNFNGVVNLDNFNLTNNSLIDMTIQNIVGMTNKVGKDIAGEVVHILRSEDTFSLDSEAATFDYKGIMEEMGKNNIGLREVGANIFGSILDGLENLVPPFGLFMLIPLIIPLVGLFFFKSTVSKFLSPTVIKILTVVLVLFIIWVIVGKFFVGKNETRRFPSSTHEMKNYNSQLLDRRRRSSENKRGGPEMRHHAPEKMSVSDVSNNLGYEVTSTKGKKRAQPYQNVNFAPHGDWTIRSN